MNEHDEALRKQTAFLGQPKGVGTLSFMQLCNSFASYAMSAVLIYYLYANAPEGLGFSKANAAQLISLYSTVVVLTGIVGSFVCDRILGCRKSLFVSRSLSFIGYRMPCITAWRSWLWNRYGMSGNRTDVRWQMPGCSSWKIL